MKTAVAMEAARLLAGAVAVYAAEVDPEVLPYVDDLLRGTGDEAAEDASSPFSNRMWAAAAFAKDCLCEAAKELSAESAADQEDAS